MAVTSWWSRIHGGATSRASGRTKSFARVGAGPVGFKLLVQLADRVHIDLWDQPALNTAETAGWLALASLYRDGWIAS